MTTCSPSASVTRVSAVTMEWAPSVFTDATLQQLLGEPDAGIVLKNVLHAEQKFRYSRPIVAGDELTAKLSVTGLRAMGAAARVTSESEITDAAGDHVVTTTTILLVGEGDA